MSLAYLKVVVNPDDDMAALRVINTPRRGIGANQYSEDSDICTA